MTDYKPGTIAVATVRGEWQRVMFVGWRGSNGWVSESGQTGPMGSDDALADIRPLVVLDLDGYSGERAVNYLRNLARESRDVMGNTPSPRGKLALRIADQIEAQTKPPKPAEPTGLGAVVEDSKGNRWVQVDDVSEGGMWLPSDDLNAKWRDWSGLDAVRVLSEGVQV